MHDNPSSAVAVISSSCSKQMPQFIAQFVFIMISSTDIGRSSLISLSETFAHTQTIIVYLDW